VAITVKDCLVEDTREEWMARLENILEVWKDLSGLWVRRESTLTD